jgi:ADP-ribose pyrophosphatase YjhB (NUDIX family)
MKKPKPIKKIRKVWQKRRTGAIKEVVREPTAGGIVYRRNRQGKIEILLIQDAKDRWTVPKGHIEEGESARDTAKREIKEETGLQNMDVSSWLGKINFRYRRQNSLVLMTTHIYLVEAKGNSENLAKEEWMNGIKWFEAMDAYDRIEYDDIGKLILLALKKLRKMGKR